MKKQKNQDAKLKLNKFNIAILNSNAQNKIMGGKAIGNGEVPTNQGTDNSSY